MSVTPISIVLCAALLLPLAATAQEATPSSANETTSGTTNHQPARDPALLLIHDESVRAELKLTGEQRRGIDDLLRQNNRLLLAVRDGIPDGAREKATAMLTDLQQQLNSKLNEPQRARLSNLALQAQGYKSLLRDDVATKLQLTDQQKRELADRGR